MSTPKMISALAKLPFIDIPYAVAAAKYAGPVAALMDTLENSSAESAKKLPASQFNWKIVYDRAADPPKITDESLFLSYLTANSKAYLKGSAGSSGGRWVGYEELPFPPAQVLALYEQRTKLVCAQRRMAQEAAKQQPPAEEPVSARLQQPNGKPLDRKIAAVIEMLRSLANDLEKIT